MSKKFNPNSRIKEETSISDVLKVFIQGNKLEAGIDKLNVKEAWINLLGPGIANYTLDVVLRNHTLYVALSSAVLREELSYGKDKIIKMINEELRKEVVKDIVLR